MNNSARKLDANQINHKLKTKADKIFKEVGLTAEQAVNVFFAKVADAQCIPFELMPQTVDDEYIVEKLKEAEESLANGAELLDGWQVLKELRAEYGKR
jgi:addiction module RelB/DinJ family antitoxin